MARDYQAGPCRYFLSGPVGREGRGTTSRGGASDPGIGVCDSSRATALVGGGIGVIRGNVSGGGLGSGVIATILGVIASGISQSARSGSSGSTALREAVLLAGAAPGEDAALGE